MITIATYGHNQSQLSTNEVPPINECGPLETVFIRDQRFFKMETKHGKEETIALLFALCSCLLSVPSAHRPSPVFIGEGRRSPLLVLGRLACCRVRCIPQRRWLFSQQRFQMSLICRFLSVKGIQFLCFLRTDNCVRVCVTERLRLRW